MTDKKTFGAFIKAKRTEKNYSQKELADMLFVTEGAISKWERGISYPDITLISDICRVLDISEHEFITASTDSAARKLKHEAHQFRIISGTWFWVPTICYTIALITCFICNLAINHTLSWFYVVLSSLVCAYTFVPTVTSFFESKKLLVFCSSTYISICLLLFTCAAYTNTFSWLVNAILGVLMGYVLLFLPLLLSKSKITRYKFLISFAITFGLTILLLLNIYTWHKFMLLPSVLITAYAFLPVIICALICTFKFNAFLKSGVCTLVCTLFYYFLAYVVNHLFNLTSDNYKINFNNWRECINGNISFICLISLLFISAILLLIGILKNKNRR